MKLEDIKKSLEHSVKVELQRSIYNACGILERSEVFKLFTDTLDDVYGDSITYGACQVD